MSLCTMSLVCTVLVSKMSSPSVDIPEWFKRFVLTTLGHLVFVNPPHKLLDNCQITSQMTEVDTHEDTGVCEHLRIHTICKTGNTCELTEKSYNYVVCVLRDIDKLMHIIIDTENEKERSKREQYEKQLMAKSVDRFALIVFIIILFVISVTCLIIIPNK